jgi:hypothetical protein
MKQILTLLLCLPIGNISLKAQQRPFTFTVNNKDYQVNETQLNDYFGNTFTDLVKQNITKQKYFELWRDSFELWKNVASLGRFSITTYGNLIGGGSYSGQISKEFLGLKDDGSKATGNPNNKDNLRIRMSYLNGYIETYIINNATEFRVNQ